MVFINEKQQAKLKEVNSTIPVKDGACAYPGQNSLSNFRKNARVKRKIPRAI